MTTADGGQIADQMVPESRLANSTMARYNYGNTSASRHSAESTLPVTLQHYQDRLSRPTLKYELKEAMSNAPKTGSRGSKQAAHLFKQKCFKTALCLLCKQGCRAYFAHGTLRGVCTANNTAR